MQLLQWMRPGARMSLHVVVEDAVSTVVVLGPLGG